MRSAYPYTQAAFVALPLLLLIYWTIPLAVDLPVWDEWDVWLHVLSKAHPTFADAWAQHNEHRFFFPQLLMEFMAHYSQWDIRWEIAGNLICGALACAVLCARLAIFQRATTALPSPIWLAISLWCFSLTQWQNWLWGLQLSLMMQLFAALLGLAILAHWQSTQLLRYFLLAALCGTIASFSFAAGLAFWPATILWLGCTLRGTHRLRYLTAWCAMTGMVLALYFCNYISPPYFQPLTYGFYHPLQCLAFLLMYIGAPVSPDNETGAFIAGIVGLASLAAFTCTYWRKNTPLLAISFFIMLLAYTCINAVMTALVRVQFGTSWALMSRYCSVSCLFWTALLVMAANVITGKRIYAGVIVLAIMTALVADYQAIPAARAFAEPHAATRAYLLSHPPEEWTDEVLRTVVANANFARTQLLALRSRKLSLFKH